jgi:hypothetical protein
MPKDSIMVIKFFPEPVHKDRGVQLSLAQQEVNERGDAKANRAFFGINPDCPFGQFWEQTKDATSACGRCIRETRSQIIKRKCPR